MIHHLKIYPCYFIPLIRGEKKFEIRDNSDRGFQRGDTVVFIEFDKQTGETGRRQQASITYVSNYNQPTNQVVFSFSLISDVQDAQEVE